MPTPLRSALLLSFAFAVLTVAPAVAQERSIQGQVTDANTGTPLPGVNVVARGTDVGTATDADGNYRLTVPAEVDSLVFSFVGYEAQTVAIGGRSVIDVQLRLAVEQLQDVVVTALGVERAERSLGYATQEVEGENLTFTNESNAIGSLAGKIAGARVVGSSGASLGGTSTIKIRGVNSLSGEGQPTELHVRRKAE